MVRSHLNRIPPIWLFFGSLLLLSLAGQAAANLIEDLGQPILIREHANLENEQAMTAEEAVTSNSLQGPKPLSIRDDEPATFQPLSGALPLIQPVGQVQPLLPPRTVSLTILKRGFSQNENRVAYAFMVNNTDPEFAITKSKYRVEFYDKAGKLLDTESEFITLILPDQTLGIAGTMNLNEESQVSTMVVNIGDGDVIKDVNYPVFALGRANFRPGEYFNRSTGLITNRSSRDLNDLKVSAIAFDEKGQIIGGGHTFVPYLFAGRSTRVDINILATGKVSSVELYPRASY